MTSICEVIGDILSDATFEIQTPGVVGVWPERVGEALGLEARCLGSLLWGHMKYSLVQEKLECGLHLGVPPGSAKRHPGTTVFERQ